VSALAGCATLHTLNVRNCPCAMGVEALSGLAEITRGSDDNDLSSGDDPGSDPDGSGFDSDDGDGGGDY